jgi:proteic killer suppression protein
LRVEIRDGELRRIVEDPDFKPKRWSADVVRAFRKKIQLLDAARDERDIRAYKALRLEKLAGDRAGTSSIRINDQYRLILHFETDDDGRIVVVLELVDYH